MRIVADEPPTAEPPLPKVVVPPVPPIVAPPAPEYVPSLIVAPPQLAKPSRGASANISMRFLRMRRLWPDFEGIWLFWEHDPNDFDRLAALKARKA